MLIYLIQLLIIQKRLEMQFYQPQYKSKDQHQRNNQHEKQSHESKLKYPSMHEDPVFDKHKQEEYYEKQQQSRMRGSVLLKDQKDEEVSCWTRICNCTKLESYKQYFNVTNQDVLRRVKSNLFFWKGGFFEPEEQEYDFYGPFWIYTTIVFCLSAVHNILKYQVQGTAFGYNFQIVGIAFGFVYVEGFLYPVIMTFILRFLGTENITHIQTICLFGYSMSVMTLCIVFCSFNNCILHIILLLLGSTVKALFILRNLMPKVHAARKLVVMITVIGEAALIFLVFKLAFIVCQTGTVHVANTSIQQEIARLQNQMNYHSLRTFSGEV